MKTIILTIGLCLSVLTVKAQEMVELEIDIENIKEKGSLMLAVFDSQEKWNKYQPVEAVAEKVEENFKKVTFNLPKGKYGIVAFVDINKNCHFDYGKEIYAFSNHYIPRENPAFEHFAVEVNQDEKITMKMVK